MKKKLTKILTIQITLLLLCSCGSKANNHVIRDDWSDDVKTAINDFIDLYGNTSKNYKENSYVVSDFDNTASIFDMCEQFMVYQAEVMGYGFSPSELPKILASGLGDMDKDLTEYGYGNGSYNDWIVDITKAYSYLYETYGPFNPSGLDETNAKKIQEDPMWLEFSSKMMNLYYLIGDNESTDVSYPWITYWYTGMSEDEVYNLARNSHNKYKQVETSYKTIKSPNIESNVGVTEYTYVEGVQVTENTKEMWKCLDEAGIDVWVCSASEANIIRAAIDEFGLHDYCTGLIGMTPTITNNKFNYTYDYDTGYCYYADENDGWHKGNVASGAQTQGIGKVEAIQNICFNDYNSGPLAGFMDSTGDYNFCSEFKDLKLVICFNRANRKVTDGGAVIASTAMYQKNILKYDLKKANEKNDTLYILQGRDENGLRTLRNSNSTIRLNDTQEKLYRDNQNEELYEYIVNNNLSTKEIINTFAIKTDEKNSDLGFKYGFLDHYSGYHSK